MKSLRLIECKRYRMKFFFTTTKFFVNVESMKRLIWKKISFCSWNWTLDRFFKNEFHSAKILSSSTTKQFNIFFYHFHFKEILSLHKTQKARRNQTESQDIKISQTKSDSSITTKTFVNEQMFIETEFIPTKPHRKRSLRQSQVNMLLKRLTQNAECFFFHECSLAVRFLQTPQKPPSPLL